MIGVVEKDTPSTVPLMTREYVLPLVTVQLPPRFTTDHPLPLQLATVLPPVDSVMVATIYLFASVTVPSQ